MFLKIRNSLVKILTHLKISAISGIVDIPDNTLTVVWSRVGRNESKILIDRSADTRHCVTIIVCPCLLHFFHDHKLLSPK